MSRDYRTLTFRKKTALSKFQEYKTLLENENTNWIYRYSQFPFLTVEIFQTFPDIPWSFNCLSENPSLTHEWLEHFPPGNWHLFNMMCNPSFKISWIKKYPNIFSKKNIKYPNNLNIFRKIPLSWINKIEPEFTLDYLNVATHPNLSLKFLEHILEMIEKNPDSRRQMYGISRHINFDISWYEKYPNYNWNWKGISGARKFIIAWYEKYPEKEWDWNEISKSENLDITWVEKYPDRNWNWREISGSKNLQISWIQKYPKKDWNWNFISMCPNLKKEWIKKFSTKKWNKRLIVLNKNVNLDLIMAFPNLDWDQNVILDNYNFHINWVPILAPIIPNINRKLFTYEKYIQKDLENEFRRYMASYKIQFWWRKMLFNPRTKLGERFVNRLYDANFVS